MEVLNSVNMKEKAELMSPPSERPKRRSTRIKQDDYIYLPKDDEEDETGAKKKKIKIRLKDPDKPHSYVCEIFDSSLENDESDGRLEDSDLLSDSGDVKDVVVANGLGTPKPKNFFDILMSKESRRNFNVISSVENEKIPEESKLLRVEESEEVVNERKSVKKRNEERLSEMVAAKKNLRKKKESVAKIESDSSDDESLFVVQSKLRSTKEVLKRQNGLVESNETEAPVTNGEIKLVNSNENETPSNERPKRSNILKYFSKVETKPAETKPKPKMKKQKLKEIDMFKNMKKPSWEIQLKNPENSNDEDDPEPEDEDEDSNSSEEIFEVSKTKQNSKVPSGNSGNVKLAPLFQKKLKKPIDPEIQKARLEFLHSGLPSAVKKQIENQKTQTVESEVVYFPAISHVQQKDENPCWNLQNISVPYLKSVNDDYLFNNFSQKFRFSIKDEISTHDLENFKVESIDDALSKFRDENKSIDVDRIFNGLREKFEKHKEKLQEIEKEKKVNKDDSVEIIDDSCNFDIYNSVWTEKYKPKSCEILGNPATVKKLEKWLQAWKAFDEEMKRLSKLGMKVKSKAATDSDDFITSDEDDYGIRSPGNTCLLTGPIGSGKTALVYALANELEFNVLEVNASSKRTGKKLLMDLQEATQSHKVHHDVGSQPLANLFEKQKNKKKLKGKRTRKKKKVENIEQQNSNCKISLILIEDADVIFEEHDEGFVPAIMSLVQSSKRPVIFLTSDHNCNHLERIKTPHCIWLQMFRPNFVISCAFLEMISILEGVFVKKSAIEAILEQNQNDLRKSILELQFWLQSGRPLISIPKPLKLGQLWWGLNKFLYNNEIKHKVKLKASKRKRITEYFDSSDEEDGAVKKLKTSHSTEIARPVPDREIGNRDPGIHEYSKILNCVTLVDMINLTEDEEPIPDWEYRPSDSLSLLENMESVNYSKVNLSNEIIGELINLSTRIFKKNRKLSDGNDRKLDLSSPSWEEISWRQQQEEARLELVSLVPACSGKEKRILNLDYLPVIRNMCRTEKHRFYSNTKRKNRFYHYLRTLGADPNDDNLDISCDVFKTQI